MDWDLAFWAAITFAAPLIIALHPLSRFRTSERTLHLMLGFSAGILGGVTFVDILPEAFGIARETGLTFLASLGIAIGFFLLLVEERYLIGSGELHGGQFHIHDDKTMLDPRHGSVGLSALTVHGFMDGFVIPVSFSAGAAVGTVVTLAVVLHQIPDSFAALSLALGTTESRRKAAWYVILTAVDTPLGIGLGALLVGLGSFMIPLGLGVSAGTFIYVSASDLVPELQHRTRSPLVVVSMILGFAVVASFSVLLPQV